MFPDGIQTYIGLAHPWMCDILGFLNTRHYAAMFDDAGCELLDQISENGVDRQTGWSDTRMVIEYHQDVRAGDFVRIQSFVTTITQTSITFLQILVGNDGTMRAKNEMTATRIDLSARHPVQLSEAIILKAQRLLAPPSPELST